MPASLIPDSSLPSYQINSSKPLKEVFEHLCREGFLLYISHSSIYILHRALQKFLSVFSGSFQPLGNAQVFLPFALMTIAFPPLPFSPGMCQIKNKPGASLVAQWLRICLPMQGTRVRALVWEDPTCRGATRPVSHNY